MNTVVTHPGGECIERIVKLKEAIQKNEYTLPIYLIIKFDDEVIKSFILEDEDQIQMEAKDNGDKNPCGKTVCPVVKLISEEKNLLIDPHKECSFKVSNDAEGKCVFLTSLN